MTRSAFVFTACVLLSAASMGAQSRDKGASNRDKGASNTDAITGTWTGELSPQNLPRPVAVTLDLKFDGKRAISGTIKGLPNPADVKTGTFDPKTGAIKLQLGKVGDSTVLLVLEGKVVKDTASGQVTGDAGEGPFKLTKRP